MTLGKRVFDQCNLVNAGIVSAVITALTEVAEIFPDGTKSLPSGSAVPSRLQAVRLVHPAVRHHRQPGVSVRARCAERRRGAEPARDVVDDARVGDDAGPCVLGGRDHQERQPDRRRRQLRQRQPEPARRALLEASQVQQQDVPRGLRRVQHLQQRLAVHRDEHVLDGRPTARVSVRPTCCRRGSSRSARSSTSNAITRREGQDRQDGQDGQEQIRCSSRPAFPAHPPSRSPFLPCRRSSLPRRSLHRRHGDHAMPAAPSRRDRAAAAAPYRASVSRTTPYRRATRRLRRTTTRAWRTCTHICGSKPHARSIRR